MIIEKNIRVIAVSAIGAVLEFYDFIIYLLLAPILAQLFFHGSVFFSLMETYAVFAIGYFFRPIGGIILAHFGDKFGRKKTFLFTIFLMTFSTFFIGALPTTGLIWGTAPILLLFFRICQGIAVGGELPASITFVFEHLPKNKRIIGCAIIFASNSCGILLASLVVSLFTNILSNEAMLVWGWRPPFFIGAIIGAIGIYIRYNLTDTPAFLELEKSGLLTKIPFFELLKKQRFETILCSILTLTTAILFTSIVLMMPLILNSFLGYNLPKVQLCSNYLLCILVASTIFLPTLIEKLNFSSLKFFIVGVLIVALTIFPTIYFAKTFLIYPLVLTCVLLSLSTGLWNGISPSVLAKCFPANVRFSGISTSYNIALAIGGGCTPMIITGLVEKFNSIFAFAFMIFISSLVCIVTLLILIARNNIGKSYYE